MTDRVNVKLTQSASRPASSGALRSGVVFGVTVVVASLLAAVFLRRGFALSAIGDTFQVGLVGAVTVFALQNALRSHARMRIFWYLVFTGALLWTASNAIWAVYELLLSRPVPDVPLVDLFIIVKVVPLTAAFLIAPDHEKHSSFRAFGLLDVLILMLYSLYLFAFGVFAYRLLPDGHAIYNLQFNLADCIGNLILLTATGIAYLRACGSWRVLYGFFFFSAACYGLGANLSNIAIDMGRYYTGSFYDIPLMASLASLLCVTLAGRTSIDAQHPVATAADEAHPDSATIHFGPSRVAMLVAITTPAFGIWMLSDTSMPPQLRSFRLVITLLTIFLLTLFVSIKQDFLTAGLFGSLSALSETYRRIDRFKTHLSQSEKLASLGELVARAANQIKDCMAVILKASSQLTARPDSDARIQSMAGKIGQYALRTDVLVDNMLQFAQETPMRLAPVEVKPILESALNLSRIAKLPNVGVDLNEEGNCPKVMGDSGQLLHVFLQLISNAVDALEEVGGGTFEITIKPAPTQLVLEFADSGPGIKEPQRVFEPFYTTKPVGKGTGLGLSTCYGIIQQHAGEIFCRNRLEGGALFTILLPFAKESLSENNKDAANLHMEGVR